MKSFFFAMLLVASNAFPKAQVSVQFGDSSPKIVRHDNELSLNGYKKVMRALGEHDLKAHRNEVYRFLLFRAFENPISIRLDVNSDGTGRLISKTTNGQSGFEPGKLKSVVRKTLSKDEVTSLKKAVEDNGFWKMPTVEYDESVIVLDGTDWIVEVKASQGYKGVIRSSTPPKSLVLIGKAFLALSGLNVPAEEIY